MRMVFLNRSFFWGILVVALFGLSHCMTVSNKSPEWEKTNGELIKKYDLKERSLTGLPESTVESNLEPAKVKDLNGLDSISLYPGVTAKLFWGSGTMIGVLTLQPNTKIPEETLASDRFLFVLEGSIEQTANGTSAKLIGIKREAPDGTHSGTPKTDFIYLEKGTKVAFTSGTSGAKLLEAYSPVRLDYLQKAGIKNLPTEVKDIAETQQPNVIPNKVYDLYDIQLTQIAEGAHTRLISGKNTQLSFISMDPNSTFPHHIHPEEQMMFVLRGACDEILLDGKQGMKANDVVRIPSNMVHGAEIGDLGCDALDIFWPARADYLEKQKAALAAYHAIIPEGVKPELIVDGQKTKPGLTFSEGPKWMNGKIYFSNMYFDKDFNADPKRSSTVELDPNGSY